MYRLVKRSRWYNRRKKRNLSLELVNCVLCFMFFQKNTPTIYYFPNEVAFTSGVIGKFPSTYYGGKISYNMPLAYPDYAIWKLLYIKRVFSRGFFDFGYFDKEYLSSVGVDLKMNFHIFRIEQELQFGVRIGYLTQLNDVFANILFNINI